MKTIDTSKFPMTTRELVELAEDTGCKVVVTHATIVAHEGLECVVSNCTRCGKPFPTELRQELTRKGQPIRSIPQCRECRGRVYRAERKAREESGELVYASVAGRRIDLDAIPL